MNIPRRVFSASLRAGILLGDRSDPVPRHGRPLGAVTDLLHGYYLK
jgi:hypothetical protein